MARIVCDADPFCYGPVATLLTVANALQHKGHRVTVLADGPAYELAVRSSGIEVLRCETTSVPELVNSIKSLGAVDLLLTVLGESSVNAARVCSLPVAYVDVLFWVWPSAIEPLIRDVELYFIEDHLGARAKMEGLSTPPRNPVWIGSIIETSVRREACMKRELLVCFGGVDSPLTPVNRYPVVLMELIAQVLAERPAKTSVLVAAGRRAINELKTAFPTPEISYESLSHEAFVSELSASRLLLTHPGLSTPLEAFAHGVPTVFMPPMNYTQVLQLHHFTINGAAPNAIDWGWLAPDWPIPMNLTERNGIPTVLERVERLEKDRSWKDRVRERFRTFLSIPSDELAQIQHGQAAFFKTLRKNGSADVATAIDSYLIRKLTQTRPSRPASST